ncbi:MAG: formate--tetrahydrofolate ligase [Erysipelotrichaceae bacterium]|nr:formate--tetrahydrofolate ligase [Erysipelotrichaceae bacterium]
MKIDIEISNESKKMNIKKIAKKLNIPNRYLEVYGNTKAKISLDIMKKFKDRENGKLILVTSTNPTPYGEGKTTMSIGINDALNKLGKNSLVVLREPSLGPVFGIKGGATGGGYSQVVPMEDINLHFTGDLHAIETCNNLLCAIIDNHIYQGNKLNLDLERITFQRCVDLNDRALRNVIIRYDNKGLERKDKYNITVASEIMAILCLATDLNDLKKRLGNILIGYNKKGKMIFARDLKCVDALAILLKDAIKPNLVQTLENNPAIIHGGPFANIAHGCNSIIATKMGLKLADYVVTEAGFGADLGAEKFLDIKCPNASIKPNAIVINATIRSMKYNGGVLKDAINMENMEALAKGIENLKTHIENMQKYTKNIIVCLNKFNFDTESEIKFVKNYVEALGCSFDISESFAKGGEGALGLASKIIKICDNEIDYHQLYDYNLSLIEKINKVCTEIYRASNVVISDQAKEKLALYEQNGFGNLPVCIAKTQYSLTDNQKILGAPRDFTMTVTDVRLSSGAGFVVCLMGNIMTMPGLSKEPAYLKMKISKSGKISGLY